MSRWWCLVALGLGACGNGPLMTPGRDCFPCHSGGGAQRFSIAGTIFPSSASITDDGLDGVTVLVVDAEARQATAITNQAGNFYLRDELTFPVTVSLQLGATVRHMEPSVMYGGCNQCHTAPGEQGAEGRAYIHPLDP